MKIKGFVKLNFRKPFPSFIIVVLDFEIKQPPIFAEPKIVSDCVRQFLPQIHFSINWLRK